MSPHAFFQRLNLGAVALTGLLVSQAFAQTPETNLSFADALSRIVGQDRTSQNARLTLESLDWSYLPTRLVLLPTATLTGAAAKSRTAGVRAETRTGELTLGLNLFRFGADYMGYQASKRAITAQEARVSDAELTAEIEGARALIRYIERTQAVVVLGRTIELQERAIRVARQRYERGLLPEQDVGRLDIDLENARARLIDAQTLEAQAASELKSLLNPQGSSPVQVAAVWPWQTAIGAQAKRLLSLKTTQTRPSIRALEMDVERFDYEATRAFRLVLPRLDALATVGTTKTLNSGRGYQDYWTGELRVTFELFDRLAQYSSYRSQLIEKSIRENLLDQAQRTVRGSIESAHRSFELSLDSASRRDRNEKNSERLYRDALRRFEAGRSSVNDLNLEQSRLNEAQLSAIRGWGALHSAYIDLCAAHGLSPSKTLNL